MRQLASEGGGVFAGCPTPPLTVIISGFFLMTLAPGGGSDASFDTDETRFCHVEWCY